jgi:hypothetical protein
MYNVNGGIHMKIEINTFDDLKALAIMKGLKISTELPIILGYKSRWGLKLAMQNPEKRKLIVKKANIFFEI